MEADSLPVGKKAYHHPGLRSALLREAAGMLRKEGIAALSLRSLAKTLKVSHTAPYRHFKNREYLLAALAEEGFVQLATQGERAMLGHTDARERLRAFGLVYIRTATQNPEIFRLMFAESSFDLKNFPEACQASERSFALLVKAVTDCQKSGEIPPGNPMPPVFTAWALVHGISFLLIAGRMSEEGKKAPSPEEIWAMVSSQWPGEKQK